MNCSRASFLCGNSAVIIPHIQPSACCFFFNPPWSEGYGALVTQDYEWSVWECVHALSNCFLLSQGQCISNHVEAQKQTFDEGIWVCERDNARCIMLPCTCAQAICECVSMQMLYCQTNVNINMVYNTRQLCDVQLLGFWYTYVDCWIIG